MRIMITGSRGQLGRSLRETLPENWELIAADSHTLDITDAQKTDAMIGSFLPDVVINTAAYTDVDEAQHHAQQAAFAVNAVGAGNVARAAQKYGIRLVHFSSDFVFDGTKETPYSEDDYPNPLNIYGKSKLSGEVLALAHNPSCLIVRTCGIFSGHGNNFVSRILNKARAQENISVISDHQCAPTYAPALAAAVYSLLRDHPSARGILHYCGAQSLSRYEFAQKIFQAAGLDGNRLQTASYTDLKTPRPRNSVLACERLKTFGIAQMPLDYAVEESVASLLRANG